MIVDLQGITGIMTDPQIHCLDKKRFGKGNLGFPGMISYFNSHNCNDFCKHLDLIHPKFDEFSKFPKFEAYNFFQDFYKVPVVPDKLIPILCDLCKDSFLISASGFAEHRKIYDEIFCPDCNQQIEETKQNNKGRVCSDFECKKKLNFSSFYYRMKRM